MAVTQHGPNLWKVTRFFVMNCYLVREEDGLTLIDSLLPGSADTILKAAAGVGLPITRITLTHAHMDHIGALDEVRVQLPSAEVAFSERTAEFLSGKVELKPGEPGPLKGSFQQRDTRPTQILKDGDKVGSLRVVAAPGHSPDHIAFYDERDGTLIAGDAYQTQGGIAVSGVVRWLFPLPAMATWHLPTALASARTLRALKPSRLAVGHGHVLENPQVAMDKAVAEAEKKVKG